MLGGAELAAAAFALAAPGRLAGPVLALLFGAFAVAGVRLSRAGEGAAASAAPTSGRPGER